MTISPPNGIDPGDWGITWDVLLNPPPETDAGKRQLLIDAATVTVWYLTGQHYGVHTEGVLIPTMDSRTRTCGLPGAYSGFWYDAIDLDPSGGANPVLGIGEVVENGNALDPAIDFGIVNNRWLVRTPSGSRWPLINDIAAAPDARLFSIDGLRHGNVPDAGLVDIAISRLVDQLWRAANRQDCTIDPSVVQSVQREGISFVLVSPGEAWKNGYTGDQAIDAACIRAWPHGPLVRVVPGWFDPASSPATRFAKFERP